MKAVRAAAAAILLSLPLAGLQTAQASKTATQGTSRLSANQFVTLDPFIVPMMPQGNEKRQFTLVVALELVDEDDREYIKALVPKLRSRMYDLLFRLIAYRTQEPLIPNTGLIKKKFHEIALGVLGDDKVESIIVQQVYHGRAP